MTQVQTTLLALASMVGFTANPGSACRSRCSLRRILKRSSVGQAKTKGCRTGVDIGVKYAHKQERSFDEEKMKAGQCVIGLQVRQAWSWLGQVLTLVSLPSCTLLQMCVF